MKQGIITVNNIREVEYSVLIELMHNIYCIDIPETGIDSAPDLYTLEHLSIFFVNQYAYMIELWATMVYEVRNLKRLSSNKEAIDEAMAKRDYLEKVASTLKLKHYAAFGLLKHYAPPKKL